MSHVLVDTNADRSRFAPTSGEPDAWPHTTRVLPWLLAVFLVMLWLLPFDAIDVRIQLPFDSKLDRAVLGVITLVWLAVLLSNREGGPRFHASPLNRGVVLVVAVAVASVLLNIERIELFGEHNLALKKLVLLASYVCFFFVVSSTLRIGELRNFSILILVLGSLAALGTIWEYRTDFNVFFNWSAKLLPLGLFHVAPDIADPIYERPAVTGPATHGLAIATMFALALPFAIAGALNTQDRRSRALYLLAAAVLLTGAIATIRKTAVIVPVAALTTLIAFRPRECLRLWPWGLAVVVVMVGLAPGAAGQVKSQLASIGTSQSTIGRTSDYEAIQPDLLAHRIIGRGYGTYDHDQYRLLDNQYLGVLIETGLLGLASYLALILVVVLIAVGPIRARDPVRGPPALAAAAAAAAFGVATALFDVLSFPQAPYLFFFVAGMAVVAASQSHVRLTAENEGAPEPSMHTSLKPFNDVGPQ